MMNALWWLKVNIAAIPWLWDTSTWEERIGLFFIPGFIGAYFLLILVGFIAAPEPQKEKA